MPTGPQSELDVPQSELEAQTIRVLGGESIPLRLTVTKDGNGNTLEALDDYRIFVETKDVSGRTSCGAAPARPVESKSSTAGTVMVAGNMASWVWTDEETRAFGPVTAFWVKAEDADGIVSVVCHGRIVTTQP